MRILWVPQLDRRIKWRNEIRILCVENPNRLKVNLINLLVDIDVEQVDGMAKDMKP